MPAHGKLFDVDDDLYIGPEDCLEEESANSPETIESKQINRGLNRTLTRLDGFCIVYSLGHLLTRSLTHSITHSFNHSLILSYSFMWSGWV